MSISRAIGLIDSALKHLEVVGEVCRHRGSHERIMVRSSGAYSDIEELRRLLLDNSLALRLLEPKPDPEPDDRALSGRDVQENIGGVIGAARKQ